MLTKEKQYRLFAFVRDKLDWFFLAILSLLFFSCAITIYNTTDFTIWNVLGSFTASLAIAWLFVIGVTRYEHTIYHERLEQAKQISRPPEKCERIAGTVVEGGEGSYFAQGTAAKPKPESKPEMEEGEFFNAKPRPDAASDNWIIDAMDRVRRRRESE